jgi:hypothetical protein
LFSALLQWLNWGDKCGHVYRLNGEVVERLQFSASSQGLDGGKSR